MLVQNMLRMTFGNLLRDVVVYIYIYVKGSLIEMSDVETGPLRDLLCLGRQNTPTCWWTVCTIPVRHRLYVSSDQQQYVSDDPRILVRKER